MDRPFQFSLQRLLGSMLLCGVGLGFVHLARTVATGYMVLGIGAATLLLAALGNLLGRAWRGAMLGLFLSPLACREVLYLHNQSPAPSPWLAALYFLFAAACFCYKD